MQNISNKIFSIGNDHIWVKNNINTLLSEYEEQWIAVQDGKVIANDIDFSALCKNIDNPFYMCIEFITKEPLAMIL